MTPTSHTGNGKDTHPILQHRINLSTTHNNHNTTTAPSSSTLLKWRKPRLTRLVALRYLILTGSALFLYLRYLHRLIFIDYSAFPARTGRVIIHPGHNPGFSAPVYNITDDILRSTTTTSSSSSPYHPLRDQNLMIDRAIAELDKRYQSVFIQPSTLSCRTSLETQELLRTRFLNPDGTPKRQHKVMIALNLHASQDVLPAITNAILNSMRYMGLENVFVSIYENGSWDHTSEGLAHLEQILTGLGVAHHIRTAKEETVWLGVDRITLLAEYRNLALSAMDQAEKRLGGVSELVFINDVYLCAQDILEVIWQRHFQKADASCGTDWKESESILGYGGWLWKPSTETETASSDDAPGKSVYLYDSWVARSLTGKTLRPRLDLLTHFRDAYGVIFNQEDSKLYQTRFQRALPVPVYSCWNGIIALDPTPFKYAQGLTFRAADRTAGECPSSECQLLAKDFWSLGFDRWIIVPKVAVTYAQNIYYAEALVRGSNRDHRPLSDRPQQATDDDQNWSDKIVWSSYSKPDTVVCWPDMYKFHIDFEWNHVLESPYNPKLLNASSATARAADPGSTHFAV